ncbi:MAG: ATPase domain-containing protein [Candidatus Aenigmatarchaeota archaeon]
MERIKTGIKGFDELLGGGFPKGSIVLITGVPGSGKTIFCLQTARNLATSGRKVLYISIDGELPEDLEIQCELLGIDIKPLIKKKQLTFVRLKEMGSDFRNSVKKYVKEGVSCIILDSLSGALPRFYKPEEISKYVLFEETTIMGIFDPNFALRGMISDIFEFFRSLNLDLTLVVTDRVEGESGLSRDSISEFIADAIIDFETLGIGGAFNRSLRILKLRKSKHYCEPVTFEIGKGGIKITERKIEEIAKEF